LSGKKAASSTPSETHEDGPILQSGNRVRHFLHRHEPPVLAGDIEVLDVSDDVVSVSKPATIPVHPTGQYRKNTVLALLAATRSDLGRLYPIHRLDKNVSGLLILARSSQSANAMRLKMEAREMRKEYVARVSGIFNKGDATAVSNDAPLGFDAKDASTKFTWMKNLDDGTSIVKCEPLTGRQHQIRAHLAMLGYPIANDVTYGGSLVKIELARRIQYVCDVSVLDKSGKLARDESLAIDYDAPRKSRETSTEICQHCPRIVHAGDVAIDLEAIWLHCMRYSGPGWEYTCSAPSWS
jgi:tRNA pseudouridine32 synthase